MAKNVKRRKLSRRILRMFTMFIIALSLLYGILYTYDGFYHGEEPEKTILSYNVNTDGTTYKVNLMENEFIKEQTLGENNSYIAELIQNISANFYYEFLMSKSGHIEYTYSVKGYLIGEYLTNSSETNTEVWNKEYPIIGDTVVNVNDRSAIRFDQNVLVDYPTINQQVIDFKNELKLPINAYYNLTFEVKIKGVVDGEVIRDTSRQVIKIPCNQLAFKIDKLIPQNKQGKISYSLPFDKYDEKNFIIGGSLFGMALIIFIIQFKLIFNIKYRTNYTKKIDRILKTYGDIIVQIVSPIDDTELNVVHVSTFTEMIDLEEELRIPINFFEYDPGFEGVFAIVHNNIIYKYIFNEDSK